MQKRILITIIAILYCLSTIQATAAPPQPVLVVVLNTEITTATTYMFKDVMNTAEDINARLIIVETDTPGGEVGAVKDIMNIFESSPIPVCLYVHPVGATAWSGGTYLLVSTHIAAMSSGTSIGSCQPVDITGQPINATKEVNALTALMVNHAKIHNRNSTAAREFISENLNLGPEQALNYHVIDLIANDAATLLDKLQTKSLIQTVNSEGAITWQLIPTNTTSQYTTEEKIDFTGITSSPIVNYEKGIQSTVLELVYNPITSGLLFTLGYYLIIIGIQTPGLGAEIIGALCIILGLTSAQVIGVEPAGAVLFLLGFGLMVAEIKTQIGLLGFAGVGCILLGFLLTFPSPHWLVSPEDAAAIRNIILSFAIILTVLFSILSYKVGKALRQGPLTGPDTLIGAEGVADSNLEPQGYVRIEGETWRARAVDKSIKEGEKVTVVNRDGLLLTVKKIEGERHSTEVNRVQYQKKTTSTPKTG